MNSRICIFAFLACLVSAESFAEQKSIFSKCQVINNDVARLNCYDALALAQGAGLPMAESPPIKPSLSAQNTGKWVVEESTDPITDQRKFTAAVTSDVGGSGFRKPTLFIRCANSSTEVFISWNDFLSDNTFVTIRFGDAAPDRSNWSPSTNETSTFLEFSRVDWFIDSAFEVDTIAAQITPYRSGPVTAVFDVAGMSDIFADKFGLCGLENG